MTMKEKKTIIIKPMKIIKNSKELAKLVDKNKDLTIDEDIRIEFEPIKNELRDVKCRNLYMEDNVRQYDFNGRSFKGNDFNGRDFKGWNFNGYDFNGRDFNGGDFKGWNFNGRDFNGYDFNGGNFNGREVSYWAFFNCYGDIKYEGEIKGRRDPYAPPVSLTGVIIDKLK